MNKKVTDRLRSHRLRSFRNGFYTSLRKLIRGSDYKRWETEKNLSQSWDSRTEQIAKLIDAKTSVIEFGAGRLVLKAYLPDGCAYTPSDLVDRGEGTVICDLNKRPLPEFQSYDFAIFSGVLEYVNDVPFLISHLSNCMRTIIASYAVIDSNKENRRARGWVNDFSSKEFIEVFENAGFQCDHIEEWQSQLIYRFRKSPGI